MKNHVSVERLTQHDRDAVAYILEHLRPEDQFEFECAGITETASLLDHLLDCPDAWLFRFKGEPVFVWGTYAVQPHVRWLWGFGTRKTWRIIPFATGWGKMAWIPGMFERTTRRVEVRVPVSSQHSISWLTKLGMVPECWALLNHSVNGEPMVQLAYTTREYGKRYVHISEAASTDGDSERTGEDEHTGPTGRRARAHAEPA